MSNFWTSNDAEQLKVLLKKVPQPWEPWFMWELNRLIPMMGVEAVVLRRNREGVVEVLLTQRDPDDITWPNEWAIPGSTLRDTDLKEDLTSAQINRNVLKQRIWSGELGLSEEQMSKIVITNCGVIMWRHKRGGCVSNIYICVADGVDFPIGTFFPADRLPGPFLGGQKILITEALAFCKKHPEILPAA